MLEQKINERFGDDDPTGFGTGWWSGILSAFFGILAFGAVVCLHFPQLLTSPELRGYYPMPLMRMLIQAVIVGAILLGVVSAMLRRKKALALTGMLFALGATLLGGASVEINEPLHDGPGHRPGLVPARHAAHDADLLADRGALAGVSEAERVPGRVAAGHRCTSCPRTCRSRSRRS